MKRLFQLALILGAVCVAYAVISRRRQSRMSVEVPWVPPVVERTPEPEPDFETSLAVATDEGMTAPPGAPAEDVALGSGGEPVVSELAGPGAEAALAEQDEAFELALALDAAADDGMTLPLDAPPEDISVGSDGQILVSELAAAEFEADVLEAEADFLDRLAGDLDDAPGDDESGPDFGTMLAESEAIALEAVTAEIVLSGVEEVAAAADVGAPAEAPLLSSVEEALGDLEPAAIVPPPRRSAESYLDEGNVYFNVGQYGLALERYGQAIELDDQLTAAFYNRANAHTRVGSFEQALSDYDRALELQPADADALNNRGMLHLYRSNYAAALGDFNRALEIDPSDTTVMVNRGLAHLHGGNAAAALVDFREATNRDSSDAAAQYGAAQAAASLGNRDEALRHVARALELDPGYAREAAADPRLAVLAGDDEFMKLLRQSGSRSS